MTFTDKDKMLARKYKEAGYEWVFRTAENRVFISKQKPDPLAIKYEIFLIYDIKRIDKRNFKPVQFSDSEPTRLDDIIGELI